MMALTHKQQHKILPCPRCSTLFRRRAMIKLYDKRGVVLDVCEHCGGMWLDREEVMMIYRQKHKNTNAAKTATSVKRTKSVKTVKKVNTNGKR